MRNQLRRMCTLFLALAMMLTMAAPALADESTTTFNTIYKSLDPNTEIYVVTGAPGGDYSYYGAKWEPRGGVYYGRIGMGGTVNGRYGLANGADLADESIVSYYYGLDDAYSLEYWSYIFGTALEDGEHAFLVNLNFPNEGGDCPSLSAGMYDAKLRETFSYLATLSCPVFLRIGGEMNVWENQAAPESFQGAYRHVAALARALCPNVALVFSPNFSGAVGVDMDSFYPGDEYVDWIGTSLYYNKYAVNGDTAHDAFYGVGAYGDPMLNIQQIVNLANLHSKPVIVTEGGSYSNYYGEDMTYFAAERIEKAYSFLPMLYPQIKCMVYSDSDFGDPNRKYAFSHSAGVEAAYDRGVANNPVLLHSYSGAPSYYTKASAAPAQWSGAVSLAAYTYAAEKQTATWYVDGAAVATASEYPYAYSLNVDALTTGSHTLEVRFGNGASKTHTFTGGTVAAPAAPDPAPQTPAPSAGAPASATPTNDVLYADGVLQTPSVYKIDGSNYFKVRDVAAILSGTPKQFEVGYDEATRAVTLSSGFPYTPVGQELIPDGGSGSVTATPSNNAIYINGSRLELTVYKINGGNYFKLRDLGQALDFYVGYDEATRSVIVSGHQGYDG